MSSTSPLISLELILQYIHILLYEPLQFMKLGILIALVFQELINVLSDIIDYPCPFEIRL